jgi:hypothetical protein
VTNESERDTLPTKEGFRVIRNNVCEYCGESFESFGVYAAHHQACATVAVRRLGLRNLGALLLVFGGLTAAVIIGDWCVRGSLVLVVLGCLLARAPRPA